MIMCELVYARHRVVRGEMLSSLSRDEFIDLFEDDVNYNLISRSLVRN